MTKSTMTSNVIPIGTQPGSPPGTKDRILDAAEALFMTHGFEATSLRAITAAAEVNLAAVNYHFGSKEELFEAVLTRRLDPMNQRRVALLDDARGARRARPGGRASASSRRCWSRRSSSPAIPSEAAATSCASWDARMRIRRHSSAVSSPRSTPR